MVVKHKILIFDNSASRCGVSDIRLVAEWSGTEAGHKTRDLTYMDETCINLTFSTLLNMMPNVGKVDQKDKSTRIVHLPKALTRFNDKASTTIS